MGGGGTDLDQPVKEMALLNRLFRDDMAGVAELMDHRAKAR